MSKKANPSLQADVAPADSDSHESGSTSIESGWSSSDSSSYSDEPSEDSSSSSIEKTSSAKPVLEDEKPKEVGNPAPNPSSTVHVQTEEERINRALEEEDARIEAVYQFNSNPKRNVGVLCAHFRKEPTPANIAYLLKTTPDLLGSKIGEYLVHPDHLDVLRAYFDQLDLHTSLLEALRLGLGGPFFMPGEAQQVQMTLEVLCDAYIAQNPGLLGSRDDAVLLAYALVILNTDMLRQVGRKMTLPEFISNTTQAMGHTQLSPEALAEMYENLKAKPFEFSPTFNDFMAMCAPKFRGYIEKKSQRAMSFWVKHFFVLTISGLYYFRDDSQECKDKPLGVIQLTEVEVRANDKNRREILLIATGQSLQYVKFRSGRPTPVQNIKKMKLRAENEELRNDWLHRIKKLAIISCFQQGTEETVASDGNETH